MITKSKNLIIVGDSAFAQIAYEYFEADTEYKVVCFSVEKNFIKNSTSNGLQIIPFEDIQDTFDPANHEVYVATTYTELNRLRTRLSNEAKLKGYKLASYISPKAFVWANAKLGEHCFIFEDNTIQPFVEIGNNVVLWSGNHIGHHSTIEDNCFIASHVVISGFCNIGENSFLGVNSTLANNVSLGKDNWICPNVVIMQDTNAGCIYKSPQPELGKISSLRFFKIKD